MKTWEEDNTLLHMKNDRFIPFKERDSYSNTDLICVDLIVGPGKFTLHHENDYDNYDDEFFSCQWDFMNNVERMAHSDGWNDDLAEYYDGDGVESIVFDRMVCIEDKTFMVWKATFNPKETDLDKLKRFITEQISDRWGESLEQHPVASYWYYDYKEDNSNKKTKSNIKVYNSSWVYPYLSNLFCFLTTVQPFKPS